MRFLMLNWRDPKNPLAGGAERVTQAYLAALVRRNHEVFWYSNGFPGCAPEDTIEGIRIVRGGGKGGSVFRAKRWYRGQPRFDLVIDQHHGIPWYAPWWCRTNCVAYIHEVLGPIWDSFYRWPLSAIGRWQERWTHWLYRKVPFWTPSECTRDILKKHGVRVIQVFPNGISTVALDVLPDKPLATPLRLVTVSRLAPNKRIDHAVRVAGLLKDRGIAARLTIIGTGDVEAPLHELARRLGLNDTVNFTGSLPEAEKDRRLQDSHFLLHTSLREGWGLNVIEANAMGTPAVVYPVAGLIESTLHDETGLVTGEETPESMADTLARASGKPENYARYRIRALERAKSLRWEKVLPPACDWLELQARGGR